MPVSEITVNREPEKQRVEKELGLFRVWFSILSFLLCAVAFAIGFPALADAGHKIGLGDLALGLPFAIDLGMVTLLLWSMWNRGALKRWWPPLIPAGALLALSSYLQYIHAVSIIPAGLPTFARWGLMVLASALPLLLALSAGVFEAVTFAPLIDRAKRHTELQREQQRADDQLWRVEAEAREARAAMEAKAMRERIALETEAELEILSAEAEARAKEIRGTSKSSRRPVRPKETPKASPKSPAPKPIPPVSAPVPEAPKAVAPLENPFAKRQEDSLEASGEPAAPVEEPQSDNPSPAEAPAKKKPAAQELPEDEALAAALEAVRSGALSQRAASEQFGISRGRLRRHLGL